VQIVCSIGVHTGDSATLAFGCEDAGARVNGRAFTASGLCRSLLRLAHPVGEFITVFLGGILKKSAL
jgi:hypothetical protein